MNRKIISILLLTCWYAPVIVVYIFLNYQKIQIKRNVEKQINSNIHKEQLTLIKINKNRSSQIKWINKKEFKYNEQMYDVVKTEYKNDTTYLWCWKDDEETSVNQKLAHISFFAFSGIPVSDNTLHQLLLNFLNAFFYVEKNFSSIQVFTIKSIKYLSANSAFWCLFKSSPPVPPPECLR